MKFTSIFISILQQSIDEWWRILRSNYTGNFSQKKKLYIKKKIKFAGTFHLDFPGFVRPEFFPDFFPELLAWIFFQNFHLLRIFFVCFSRKNAQCISMFFLWTMFDFYYAYSKVFWDIRSIDFDQLFDPWNYCGNNGEKTA